ncbi:MAG: CxxC-x17-CxxC domain-containing protein [Candidatus Bathyarchaeia archaeon]
MSQEGYGGRTMYKVTCSDCGAETEVPFKPTQGRPVYCRACYQKHRQY